MADLHSDRGEVYPPGCASPPQQNAAAPRLMIVDDEPRSLRIFRRILIQADRHCLAFERANDAFSALREHAQIEVIVTDLRMPQVDGLELIRMMRSQFGERPWIQFIVVTGQASIDTAISALRLDAVDYLFKPVLPQNLLTSVRQAMQKTRALRSMHSPESDALDRERMHALAQTARSLAAELVRISQGALARVGDQASASLARGVARTNSPAYAHAQDRAQDYQSLRFLMELQEARRSIFGEATLADAAWEMLAELMLAKLTGRRIAVTSLCLASKGPVTTALRRIDDLIAAGLAVRTRDDSDRRRSYVELSEAGQQKMRQLLGRVAARLDSGEMP
jgi:CheY-like chemotaxis protein/DNA-binding MarR family transcriptional regulator